MCIWAQPCCAERIEQDTGCGVGMGETEEQLGIEVHSPNDKLRAWSSQSARQPKMVFLFFSIPTLFLVTYENSQCINYLLLYFSPSFASCFSAPV